MLNRESHVCPFSTEDRDLMIEILPGLVHWDREALFRFYVDGHKAHQIEVDLDLNTSHFQELRRNVRAAFSERKAARIAAERTMAHR